MTRPRSSARFWSHRSGSRAGIIPIVLARTDGTVLTGLFRAETESHIELIDADLKRISIPRSDVEDRRVSEISLMPTGLVDSLTPAEFTDLVAYLQCTTQTSALKP